MNSILYLSNGVLVGACRVGREREGENEEGGLASSLPLIRMVTDLGLVSSSTNVYLSSPYTQGERRSHLPLCKPLPPATVLTRTCSYTTPANPRHSGSRSSNEFMATPPHASVSLSMFLRLALRRATISSLASRSSDRGSMPYTPHVERWNQSTTLYQEH